ncbi:MAG: hypothetical protein ACKVP7_26175 [Hyphomicrobiaceae bacterium]
MPEDRPTSPRKVRILLSVPLSPDQKSELVRRAGVRPISAYARDVLFPANDNPAPRRASPRDREQEQLAASILAQLGKGEAASSLREIARGVRLGTIVVTPETDAVLREAAANVNATAQAALRALGVRFR